jgi:polyisoprenoid-binding protein YceI
VLAAALLSAPALAVEYGTVDPAASTLKFEYAQMGVSLDGAFKQFNAELSFDPARPQAARTVVEVPLKAIDTGSEEGDEEVGGKDWFNTGAHPLARFESNSVKVIDSAHLEVSGTLTIKGRSRDITTPVVVTESAGKASFEGSFKLNRVDFGIGEGMWAKDDVVAHEITIAFHLVATPVAK